MKQTRLIAGVILLFVSATLHADPTTDAMTVTDAAGKATEWTPAKIKTELAAEVTTVSYSGKDGKHTATAVPLASLLKASGVTTQLKPDPTAAPRVKHAELHYAVTVEGRDGYYTVFSIGELMNDVGNAKVWVALDVDGKPLPTADGPVKLIAADDQKPARSVHAISKISLVKVEPPATEPSEKK
jgi:hypothetical protein